MMLAIFVLSALMGLALGDPLPPVQKHTEIIHVPAPKPVVKKVPALQEHAVRQIQHVPIRQTVVKEINVPKDIYREVPVIVEKKLILRQPHIRKFPIDVQKTLLQPHIKHVPQVRVNYRKRPYDVWHTKEVKKIINVPRPVPVIKHKIITKVLNRIVDVPHKVYKDKVKVVQVPQPFKVQKVHHRKIDVPIEVRVPVPRVHVKQTQEVQKVPIDVTVVKKVAIPRRTTLTEIVPVPVKQGGYESGYDDSLAAGAGQLGAGGVVQGAFFNGASNDDGDNVGAFADTSFLNGGLAAAHAFAAQAQAQAQAQAFNGGAQAFNGVQGFHSGQGFGGAQGLGAAVHGVHGFNGGAMNVGQAFGGAEAAFGGAEAAFAGAQAQAAAQSQAQAQAFAQAQTFGNAQANQIGNSLQSDLQLANQLAFNDKYDVNNYGH
uniref:Valine-rich protein-like isoform X4 n=1 Tax=Crassostrea virginica TaxID=6565 RepID=A0A8B8BWG5_CRAVI|nr:valine-rich protein-like isoform X4 [Crassostrea virginica]